MSQSHPLRQLPSVNELLEMPVLSALIASASHAAVANAARDVLDDVRRELKAAGAGSAAKADVATLAAQVAQRVAASETPPLRPVINATGILLHTGLGRAPLSQAAIDAMSAVSRSYASVELNLETGARSQRAVAVESLLRELTGAEAALVVNNNAGATLLTLAAMAAEREVIVSRGELIEIGGSFRLPDVMSVSRAKLHEVGTTNKTRLSDYAQAINEATAALMLVHPSNFAVVGFTARVPLAELVQLGRARGLAVIHDIGSGALIDFAKYDFAEEPIAGESIAAGADVVLFSGDKLLGGPQAGIIIGSKQHVAKIAAHPLARAFRVDKLTLAALRATLQHYRHPAGHAESAQAQIPLLRLLEADVPSLRQRAEQLAADLRATCPELSVDVRDATTFLGGGSIPAQELPTVAIALSPGGELSVDELAARLRAGQASTGILSVVGRIHQDRLFLDLRSVFPREDAQLLRAVQHAFVL